MKSYDVIIIGRGVTALSTAWHLYKQGITRICVIGPRPLPENCASLHAGHASISLSDNITRTAHNLGTPTTKELLTLSRTGFLDLINFAENSKIPHTLGEVIRLSTSEHENIEMTKAVDWLQENGFPASLTKPAFPSTALKIQTDGCAAASLDCRQLLQVLEKSSKTKVIETLASNLHTTQHSVEVKTSDGQCYAAEMLVAGCHLGLKSLIPELAPALVNHADQSMVFEILKGKMPLNVGDLMYSDHSQFWMNYHDQKKIVAGGARYLRKWAGIEAESAPVLDHVISAVRTKLQELFPIILSKPTSALGCIDLRACDEQPVIGPMFGESRILIATGYMGSGMTFGFAAGKGLAEFIQQGTSKTIPSVFHPARLRSLAESS
jgi:glycine/D-amino acid oxidase-like deaminating enzyme